MKSRIGNQYFSKILIRKIKGILTGKLCLFLLLLMVHGAFSQQKVKVHVQFTNAYCGGARPSQEVLDRLNRAKDLEHTQLRLIYKGETKVKTNEFGHFKARLRPGTYHIYIGNEKASDSNFDPTCAKMLEMSFGELVIEKGKDFYEVTIKIGCNPCLPPRP